MVKNGLSLLGAALTSLHLIGCFSSRPKPSTTSTPDAISIMTFNVENLFDTADDPKKKDDTYLPVAMKNSSRFKASCDRISNPRWRQSCLSMDWNPQVLEKKMQRIAKVILQVNGGRGPDVVILEEVENQGVLEELRKNHLQAAGYGPAILVEGPDRRGIDVGMLSRLPTKGRPQLHHLNLRADGKLRPNRIRPTRGVLHSRFTLPDSTILHILGVHFPSQANPSEAREQGIALLQKISQSVPKDDIVVVGGDFNISRREDNRRKLYKKKLAADWLVSHHIGCKNCKGTHSYRGKWSFLDALLFSKNLAPHVAKKWAVVPSSVRVVNGLDLQVDRKGRPARFEEGRHKRGVSDHWPLVAEIRPQPSS